MKRAVLLHGTSSHPTHNWQPWIKKQLELAGYEVFAPELPDNDVPSRRKYDMFLRSSGWDFSDNLLIGHSSGATTILNLLSSDWLPHVKSAVLVGTFLEETLLKNRDSYIKDQFVDLFPSDGYDTHSIQKKVDHMYFIHGDQDPLCDIDTARAFCRSVGGTFITVQGAGHFSSPATELPEIISTLQQYSDF